MKNRRGSRLILILLGVFLAAWVVMRYLMPVILPFLFGAGVAALAEPGVARLSGKGKMHRTLAAGLCVTAVYLALGLIVYFLGVVIYRELGGLVRSLPQIAASLTAPAERLRNWIYSLTDRAPGDLRPALETAVSALFEGTSALAGRAVKGLLSLISGVITHVPDGLLFLGTAVISSFMFSAQYPKLKGRLRLRLPEKWAEQVLPAVENVRKALGGWFRAQAKLMGVTFLIVTAGLTILRVQFSVLFGALIALVDAAPMLGTGTVLIPWSVLRFLDGDPVMGLGLLALYGVAMTTRAALEPRLIGKHMGLNPLLTLIALYAGYRLWGVLGMLLAPVLAITAMQIYTIARPPKKELQSQQKTDMM